VVGRAGVPIVSRPSTHPSTKLREAGRTGTTSDGLSKPQQLQHTTLCRYRTQEVAGSSPASSISELLVRDQAALRDESKCGRLQLWQRILTKALVAQRGLPTRQSLMMSPSPRRKSNSQP
jgi:hypothetical protein